MEIGLDLTAAYEEGQIFTSDLLYIDEKEYMNKFCTAYSESLNLAVYAGYPTKESIKIMLSKSASESRSLSIEIGFVTVDTAKDILRKAFNPFFTTKMQGEGTGLGLGITQRLMQRYAGNIEIQSDEGKGTEVSLFFPIG